MYTRKTPEQLRYLEAMLKRSLKPETQLLQQIKLLRTGYAGERRVDREWKEVKIAGQLLHDFTCFNEFGHTHQIDSIFICKHFILLLEIKNISGRIDFDDHSRQFVRTRENGIKESFLNPVDQIKRHHELLQNASLEWSEYLPIEAAIIIANPHTVIGRLSNEVPIFNVTGLRTKVAELVDKYRHIQVNVKSIVSNLEKMYRPIHRFEKIKPEMFHLKRGVLCINCGYLMEHSSGGFKCRNCGVRDRHDRALAQTLQDYYDIYGEKITNKQFRDFIGIENLHTAYTMLQRLNIKSYGKTSGKYYIIPENIGKLHRSREKQI